MPKKLTNLITNIFPSSKSKKLVHDAAPMPDDPNINANDEPLPSTSSSADFRNISINSDATSTSRVLPPCTQVVPINNAGLAEVESAQMVPSSPLVQNLQNNNTLVESSSVSNTMSTTHVYQFSNMNNVVVGKVFYLGFVYVQQIFIIQFQEMYLTLTQM